MSGIPALASVSVKLMNVSSSFHTRQHLLCDTYILFRKPVLVAVINDVKCAQFHKLHYASDFIPGVGQLHDTL